MNRSIVQTPYTRTSSICSSFWRVAGLCCACSVGPVSFLSADAGYQPYAHVGDAPNANQDSSAIDSLIRQLGDPDFFVRENAEKELLQIGRSAIGPVKKSRFARDTEIRLRSNRLLVKLLRNDFQVQINAFLMDRTDQATLPAWKAFSKITGHEKNAKELFAVLYTKSPELFRALQDNDVENAIVHYRRLVAQVRGSQFRSIDVVSILFADTIEFTSNRGKRHSAPNSMRSNGQLPRETARMEKQLANSNTVGFVNASGFKKEFDAILARWIQHLPGDDRSQESSSLLIIEKYGLAELIHLVVEIFIDVDESIYARAKAISVLAKLGSDVDIESLRPLLDNQQIVGHFKNHDSDGQRVEVQIRDIALAASVVLSGQTLNEYGFATETDQDNRLITLRQSGFKSERVRTRAFELWHQFHQEHEGGPD